VEAILLLQNDEVAVNKTKQMKEINISSWRCFLRTDTPFPNEVMQIFENKNYL